MVLRLPKLLDDGCVLQAGATIHIWGTGDPGRGVLVRLDGKDRTIRVGDDGSWSVSYGPITAGGPYDLTVRYEDGTECISRQCYAGEVFLCSGQSNMELPWLGCVRTIRWSGIVSLTHCCGNTKRFPIATSTVPAAIMTMRSGRGAMRKPLEISPRSPISSDAGSVSG